MVINRRKLFGFIPYTTVFFPAPDELEKIAAGARPHQLTKFFWTTATRDVSARTIHGEQTATVCIDLRNSPEQLFQAVAKNCRNEIRNAERLADRVRIERNGTAAEGEFLSIYNEFARVKHGVSSTSLAVLSRYATHADYFIAYLDDRPLCAHVFLRDNSAGRARLLYSASRRLEDQATARLCGNLNRLLHWREITAYRDDGLTTYDFGGIRRTERDGIAKFKTSFGGEIISEFSYLSAGSAAVATAARFLFITAPRLARQGKGDGEQMERETAH